ncbi:MAG: N-acetylmuramoyl-L-alanine amidase [Chitinophagaceae bacterium]
MIKKIVYCSVFLFTLPAIFSFVPSYKISQSPKATIRTIIIDPGHGGDFSGAEGLKSLEKEVSLSVALKFGQALQAEFPDIKVIYTRTTDANAGNKTTLRDDLNYRADLANASGGDLFLSFHCNSAGKKAGGWYEKVVTERIRKTRMVKRKKKKVKEVYYEYKYANVWRENVAHGTESYIWAADRTEAKTSSIAKNNDYTGEIDSTGAVQLPDPSDPAEKARMLIYAQQYFKKSLIFADMIQKEFAKRGRVDRGVKQRNDEGIWVLQATGMPSVLVELGFISNKEEEQYINSDQGQEEMVTDIMNAFRSYKQRLESKTTSSASGVSN